VQVNIKGGKSTQPLVTPGFQAEVVEEITPAAKKRKLVTLDGRPLMVTEVKEGRHEVSPLEFF
jgi:hypothetical protein